MNSNIDPNKLYSLTETLSFIPFIKSLSTLRKYIHTDMKTENRFKTIKWGRGIQSRYYIKGENIIKFLVEIEQGAELGGGEQKMEPHIEEKDPEVEKVNEEVDKIRDEEGKIQDTNPADSEDTM